MFLLQSYSLFNVLESVYYRDETLLEVTVELSKFMMLLYTCKDRDRNTFDGRQ